MSSPAQMFDHELNGVKGFQPGMPWIVDKAVDLDDAVTATDVKAGMVMHQDPTSKKFKLGAGTVSGTVAQMTYFVFQNGDDFDVLGDDGNIVGAQSAGQVGRLMGVASNQAAELETTEYDSGTYTPGKLLIAGTDGKLELYVSGAAILVGTVTDGVITSEHSSAISLLRFHSIWHPKFS